MADAIGSNPWQNFFNNTGNTNTADDLDNNNDANDLLPGGDALEGAEDDVNDAVKAYEEYMKAESSIVAKAIQTFAPIFKSFIDDAIEMKE